MSLTHLLAVGLAVCLAAATAVAGTALVGFGHRTTTARNPRLRRAYLVAPTVTLCVALVAAAVVDIGAAARLILGAELLVIGASLVLVATPIPTAAVLRSPPRALVGVLIVGMMAAAGIAAELHVSRVSVPPRGTVLDAETGAIVPHPVVKGPDTEPGHLGQVGGGQMLFACILTIRVACRSQHTTGTIQVHPGTIVLFSLLLWNPGPDPLPYLRVRTALTFIGEQNVKEVDVDFWWPHIHPAYPRGTRAIPVNPVYLALPRVTEASNVEYIPGSTALFDSKKRFLAKLPDGIMDDGIALANVGPREGCFNCVRANVRYIRFAVRIT